MPKISDNELKLYFSSDGSYYPLYKDSVEIYNALRVHADGEFPKAMIEMRRPSESLEILEYRQKTYKPITKLPVSKVITSFGKIRRSPDWNIDFPKDTVSSRIPEEETLANYCTKYLPGYTSIDQWAFGILLKQNLIDPNAVIAVIPLELITPDAFAKPVPILFNSDQVMQFNEKDKWCLLRSKRKATYSLGENRYAQGDIFYYIDDQEIIVYEQNKDGYGVKFTQVNTTKQFPAFKVRAESYKQFDNMNLSRSRLDAMVPFLDEAACEYSDLKGSKVQHLFPLMWFVVNKECKNCGGKGKTPTDNGPVECNACNGKGRIPMNPFTHIEIDPAKIGEQAVPVPAAGVVERDTQILELQEKSVEKNLYKSLGAVNMQFLDQTPLNVSGLAKNVDREELNNTVYNSAEDLIHSIDKSIYFINEWRYNYIVSDASKRKAMLPSIPVPQNYDLLPEDYLMKEVTEARSAKINPLLIATLEQQLAAKKFYNQPDLAGNIKLYFDLDPLPGISIDEKMSLISNSAITKEDFVISSYMAPFIKRAIREDKEFCNKKYDEQIKVLTGYAVEKINANDAAAQMIDTQKQKVLEEIKNEEGSQSQPPAAA